MKKMVTIIGLIMFFLESLSGTAAVMAENTLGLVSGILLYVLALFAIADVIWVCFTAKGEEEFAEIACEMVNIDLE